MGGPIYCIKKIFGKSKKLVKKSENAKEVFWRDEFYNSREIVILATRHVEYVAESIKAKLRKVGIKSSVIHSMPDGGYSDLLHIVICPQMFQKLPRLYFAYQLEQRTASGLRKSISRSFGMLLLFLTIRLKTLNTCTKTALTISRSTTFRFKAMRLSSRKKNISMTFSSTAIRTVTAGRNFWKPLPANSI